MIEFFRNHLGLWLLAAVHVAVVALMPWLTRWIGEPDHMIGAILGVAIAQAALFAVLAAWFDWPGAVRWPVALFGLAASWLGVVYGLRQGPGQFLEGAVLFGGMLAGQFVVIVAVLTLARMLTSWRVAMAPPPLADWLKANSDKSQDPLQPAPPDVAGNQFRLVHLILWMTLAAALCALVRVILPEGFSGDWSGMYRILIDVAIIALVNVLLAMPLAAAMLHGDFDRAVLCTLAFALVYAPVLLGIQWWVLGTSGAPLLAIDGAFLSLFALSLLWLRILGWVWTEPLPAEVR